MKKYLIIWIFLLSSCHSGSLKEPNCEPPLEYSLWAKKIINWDDVFQQMDNYYYVYFYSPRCGYCEKSKQSMLCFYAKTTESIYVIGDTSQMRFGVVETKSIIGQSSITEFVIPGTPTLIYIELGKITEAWVGAKNIEETLISKL